MTPPLTYEQKLQLISQSIWQLPQFYLPGVIREYPTMLTREELRMLRFVAEYFSTADGVICDLGSFLGGSTLALADGIRLAGQSGKRLHSYDRHVAQPHDWEKYGLAGKDEYPEEGFFRPLLENKWLAEWADLISFQSGLFQERPVPQEPIDVLFVDIAKLRSTHHHVLRQYFPKLKPGYSIVIQQDYFTLWPYWDVAVMEAFSDCFEKIGATTSNSALFRCVKVPTRSAIEDVIKRLKVRGEILQLLEGAAQRWECAQHKSMLLTMKRVIEATDELPDKAVEYHQIRNSGKIKCTLDDYLQHL